MQEETTFSAIKFCQVKVFTHERFHIELVK